MKDNRQNTESKRNQVRNLKMWQSIAYIAGAFSFIICVLLIANYLQMKKVDPIEQKALNTLIERLNENPEDEELREEIRTFDYISRKAYFTNTWQVRTGGYLLLIGIALVVISMQAISLNRKKQPDISTENPKVLSWLKKNPDYGSSLEALA
jgi:outer membrane protein assembly factor BamB